MVRLSVLCALVLVLGCGDDDDDGTDMNTHDEAGKHEPTGGKGDETKDASMTTGDAATSSDAGSGIDKGLDCMATCELMVEPGCKNGPPSVSLCVILCDSIINGDDETCSTAFQALLDCLDPTVEASCNAAGDVVASRCQPEIDELDPCLP